MFPAGIQWRGATLPAIWRQAAASSATAGTKTSHGCLVSGHFLAAYSAGAFTIYPETKAFKRMAHVLLSMDSNLDTRWNPQCTTLRTPCLAGP
jgi:hypothetical protein